ncbi:ABC transporter substrate-binding protein [Metallumcola ferriviriculae]|uniref:ABC transporter substrate-binding protein n=1 Tax=Metallumcola ferriviriculae TaxID=3039180 RepID=A0AAU0UJX6_9FIRM|nr:ABC transporter substrate-binding protein [Desulfitibacteraceae bacterium MK1]
MFKKLSMYLLISLMILSLAAVVGCSSQTDNGAGPDKEQAEKEQPKEEAKPEKEVISFAGSGGYPPFNFVNEKDEVVGFDVDVANEIATRLGMDMKYVTTAWDGIIEGLRAKRYDGILGSMAITEDREKQVDFSIPYYYSGAQLIVMKDSDIKTPDDLTAESVIGVATGTTFADDVEKLGAQARTYEDDFQTLMELQNGRLAGVITDRVVGLNAIKEIKNGDRLTLAGKLLRQETMGIAFHSDDDELREKVDAILEEMHQDGTLTEISAKWFDGEDITKQ